MSRREFSRKIRKAAIDRADGHCEKCSAVLKKGEAEVDHILPDILGGEPTLPNAQVLCRVCHSEKTADDIRHTRRADRARDKASGAIRPAGSLKGPGFPKSAKPKHERIALPPRQMFASGAIWPTGLNRED